MEAKTIAYLTVSILWFGFFWHCSADEEPEEEPLVTNFITNIEIRVFSEPNPPSNLDVAVSSGNLRLSWDEVWDAQKYEYRIRKSAAADGDYVRSDTDASGVIEEPRAEINNLTNGVEYSLQLRTVGAGGKRSQWSGAVVVAPAVIHAPERLEVDGGDSQLDLRWASVSNASSYEVAYRVALAGAGGFLLLASNADGSDITAPTFAITSLTNGTEYVVRVRIVDDEGRRGPWSDEVNALPFVFAAPTNVEVVVGDGKLLVVWDEVVGAASYHLRRKRTVDPDRSYVEVTRRSGTNLIDDTNFTISNLVNGRNYTVQVRSVNAEGWASGWSSAVRATASLVAAPANLMAAEEADQQVKLTWNAVSNAVRYQIQYRAEGDGLLYIFNNTANQITTTNYRITGLVNNRVHTFWVRSVNALGDRGDWSAVAMGTPYSTEAPTNLLVVPHHNALQLSWSSVPGAGKYHLRHKESTAGDGDYTTVTNDGANNITAANFTIGGLTNGTNYSLQVRSVANGNQVGEWSEAVMGIPVASLQPPIMTLATNTGIDDNDAFTKDATIKVVSRQGATITIAMQINGSEHTFSAGANTFTIDGSGLLATNLADMVGSIVPNGLNTNRVSVTATASHDHDDNSTTPDQTATSSALRFTMVGGLASSSEVDAVTVALEEDTGEGGGADMDSITTNPNVVVGGVGPANFALSFRMLTNGDEHSQSVTSLGTNDFGLGSLPEPRSVSLTPVFTIHGHTIEGNEFNYVLLPSDLSSSITVSYEDDGNNNTDGMTTRSVLTVNGFNGLDGPDIKVSSYVITNQATQNSTTNDIPEADRMGLNEDYELDMRRIRNYLGDDEAIHGLTFNYEGNLATVALSPALHYHLGIRFNRQFPVAESPNGIAITTNDVLLITANSTDKVHFYDTNGNDVLMEVASSGEVVASNFGGHGNADNEFNNPLDIAVGAGGRVYVADDHNRRLQIYNADFSYRTNLALPPGNQPKRLTVYEGYVYLSTHGSGDKGVKAYSEVDLSAVDVVGGTQNGVAFDAGGVLHRAWAWADTITPLVGNPETGFTGLSGHSYSTRISGNSASTEPYDLKVGSNTGLLYVSDRLRHQVLVLSYDGDASSDHYVLVDVLGHPLAKTNGGTRGKGTGEFDHPSGMLIHNGQLYVVDSDNHRVQVFDIPE